MRSALALALVAALAAPAAADGVAIGLFAPTAPFDGPVARLEFVSQFATHVGAATGGGGVGRAYARAADFAAAVKRGEIQYAIVDASYLAAQGVPYQVLATAVRDGATGAPWELVTTGGARGVLELRGKTVAVPKLGARDEAFLAQVLLEGELGPTFFGKVVAAPDALSAIATLGVGRADAAFVPLGLPLPGGARRLFTVPEISWPVLVALPGANAAEAEKVAAAATSFAGGSVFQSFRRGADGLRGLAGRFGKRERRGPMAVEPPRFFELKGLLAGRKFAIEKVDVRTLAEP